MDDIKVFIRDYWSMRISPEDYTKIIHDKFDRTTINQIGIFLTELCGKPNNPSTFLMEYFFNTVKDDPVYLYSNIDENKPEHVRGVNRLVASHGDILFNSLNS